MRPEPDEERGNEKDDERDGWVMSVTAISRDGRCVWLSEETLHKERDCFDEQISTYLR